MNSSYSMGLESYLLKLGNVEIMLETFSKYFGSFENCYSSDKR